MYVHYIGCGVADVAIDRSIEVRTAVTAHEGSSRRESSTSVTGPIRILRILKKSVSGYPLCHAICETGES